MMEKIAKMVQKSEEKRREPPHVSWPMRWWRAPATLTNGGNHDIIRRAYSTIVIFASSSNWLGSGEPNQKPRMPYCEGPLHDANSWRKPRGGPPNLEKLFELRYSLCCGREGCRRRVMPPSVRFWGRRVYWAPVILGSSRISVKNVSWVILCETFAIKSYN